MGGNRNHPKKGSIIKVEPIRRREDRRHIEVFLAGRPRDLALFVTGTNTNVRASDLVRLAVGHVRGVRAGDELVLREKKTRKVRRIVVNAKVVGALQAWLAVHPWRESEGAPLFPNRRTGNALTVPAVSTLVKGWCRAAGLAGNYASHSLRKSFGYAQRVEHGVGVAVLMTLFGHSSERQTLSYLGVDDGEVRAVYLQEV